MPSVSLSESVLWFLKQIQIGEKDKQKILLIYDPPGEILGNIHIGRKAFYIFFHKAVRKNRVQRIFCEKFTGVQRLFENVKASGGIWDDNILAVLVSGFLTGLFMSEIASEWTPPGF